MNNNWCILKNSLKRYNSTTPHKKTKSPLEETLKPASKAVPTVTKKSHRHKLAHFFKQNPHIAQVKKQIPQKYFALKRITPPENLYLIDDIVAKKVVSCILPEIKQNENQIVCETNAGLGFITSHLLENGVKLVRLYESCPDFKVCLKEKFEKYLGRVELFTKDIFLLHRYEYIDKQDHGNRVEQLLKGVPRKSWIDDPVMTIIGPLPNNNFIRFLIKAFVLQTNVVLFGRLQLYVFMRPRDYVILTAGPHLNLHTYQRWSILFNLFFDTELLDKFPREIFLPWQSPKVSKTGRYPSQVDPDLMYFVRINFKKDIPVSIENLLPLYAFVVQFFGKGTNRIIPVLEKWAPGCGVDIMIPKLNHKHYFKDINIFTKFGELTPEEILAVFREMITHSGYKKSHFMAIIESQLIKTETIESTLDDHLEKNIVENVETIVDKID